MKFIVPPVIPSPTMSACTVKCWHIYYIIPPICTKDWM